MLFDTRPKASMDEVFGRKAEYWELVEKIENGRNFFVITGPRRIGKTTFLTAALNDLHEKYKIPHIIIDARAISTANSKNPQGQIVRELLSIKKHSKKRRLSKIADSIEGITIKGVKLKLKKDGEYTLPDILRELNDSNDVLIIAYDEAQYFRYANEDFTKILAWVYDKLPNIITIVTGSQVGVLENFLRFYDYKAPLYGRYHVKIPLTRFTPSQSFEFLERGFEEYGLSVGPKEILSAIKALDGVPGWLTHYGASRVDGKTHWDAIQDVLIEAEGYIRSEFEELDRTSPRYRAIMEIVAGITSRKNSASWTEIKNALELREGKGIDDKNLNLLLKKLVNYGFLEHVGREYIIPDPVVRRLFQT
ncbi:ATP-binding protein [Thermococcus prieurii]